MQSIGQLMETYVHITYHNIQRNIYIYRYKSQIKANKSSESSNITTLAVSILNCSITPFPTKRRPSTHLSHHRPPARGSKCGCGCQWWEMMAWLRVARRGLHPQHDVDLMDSYHRDLEIYGASQLDVIQIPFNDSLLQDKVCLRGYLPLPSQAH